MSFTHVLLTAWLTASAADAGSTAYALNHGAYEANPLGLKAAATVKAASALTGVWYVTRFEKEHPRFVKFLAAGAAGAYTYATIHNLRVGAGR